MGNTEVITRNNFLKNTEWMCKSKPDPWSNTEPAEWSRYSDVENLIIERAYSNGEAQALLDEYYIDFKANLQISTFDENQQRPVKRMVRQREDKHLREERFMDLPISSKRTYSGQYGWVSAFVIEVRKYLKLQPADLPSKKPELIPILVERAAEGIIQEGKYLKKEQEGKELANMLREQKDKKIGEVWKCCAYLYSLESFLYKTLNATMRLVGDQEQEQVWRSKVCTLGPFCLLLWDDPLNKKPQTSKTLYRGANLTSAQISNYEQMSDGLNQYQYQSFQAFTSCSRNREKAEEFGNTLFIMQVKLAFTADLSGISEYPEEEEELITPGVCFRVTKTEYDCKKNKHLIYLQLRQQYSSK
ncbi:unnamed protein product [Rotaria sp. Silwood2]|nr:unnamed protein product [Rotaria sp. Silwood2]CAF2953211.1 unnamed protein product [Rotaria sp. Silwood2]CAF3072303.1 unnamed protein product [Rotaria sp. Silwood2]CAF3418577.1 unnamed protein product [Rotaria sp. Silwood2]CAF3958796.1 unnamed protein product [Rotaria sp. Silwood2]